MGTSRANGEGLGKYPTSTLPEGLRKEPQVGFHKISLGFEI